MDNTDSSAPAHPATAEKLAKLEERYRHELTDAEERREYARAGGYLRSRRRPDELERVKRGIMAVTAGVLQGQVERGAGAVVLQGLNTYLRAVEVQRKLEGLRELEESVEELRERLAEARKRHWGA